MKTAAFRRFAALITALIITALSGITVCADDTAAQPVFHDTTAAYNMLNAYRMEHNQYIIKKSKKLKALRRDRRLDAIAKIRAEEMALTGVFSHTRPNGKSGLRLIKGRKARGENIAMGQTSCEQVSAEWYASPDHRANMLRRKFRKVGLAACTYNGVTYWVQIFSS